MYKTIKSENISVFTYHQFAFLTGLAVRGECMAFEFDSVVYICTNENDQSFKRGTACQHNTVTLTEHAG